jgi:TetR/AcrR family transcriptional regulator, mexCD-oprJ operon repressor
VTAKKSQRGSATRNVALRDQIATSVLEAAAAVLAQRGETTSMGEIARAAGVGRATLYRYFPSREALMDALAQAAVEELTVRITAADLDTVPVAEGIARLTRAFLSTGSKYVAFMRSGRKPNTDPGEADRLLAEPLRVLFQRGIEDGTLRTDLTPEVLQALYGGLIEAAIPLATKEALGVERASAATTALFLHGAAKAGSGPAR